jgi:hypothetical protein
LTPFGTLGIAPFPDGEIAVEKDFVVKVLLKAYGKPLISLIMTTLGGLPLPVNPHFGVPAGSALH